MPFGKYKGKALGSIPDSYLVWVLGNCDNLRSELKEAIICHLDGKPEPKSIDQQITELFDK
jgi:hypothetical protein